MKTVIILIMFGIGVTSCSSIEYNTRHQASTMRNFQKQKHGKYVPLRKRSDVMHPAVTKATRKTFKN